MLDSNYYFSYAVAYGNGALTAFLDSFKFTYSMEAF